jgi:hypothetical protein
MQKESQQDTIRLFNYYRSSASFRVRIALNFKKLKYEYIPIHLLKGEQKNEDYIKKNPMKVRKLDSIKFFQFVY